MFPSISVLTEDYTSIVSTNQEHNVFYAGHFERGPVNEIQQITSQFDLKVTFGKPTKDNIDQYMQIYNYFAYGNACIYIARTDSDVSECAKSDEYDVKAKYPGDYGNNLIVEFDGTNIHTFLNNKLVETISNNEESYYIDYNDLSEPFKTRLSGGIHNPPNSVQIEEAYELAQDDNFDFEFIIANKDYEYPAVQLAENKCAIAFTYTPQDSGICYQGTKKQTSIFDGKEYSISLLGDAVGLRTYLINNNGFRESHCKRSYSIMNINSAKILNLKELYNKKINSISKGTGYYFYSETLANGNNLTQEVILNNLKKVTKEAAQYFVFEINDEFTQNDFKKKVTAVCQDYKDNGYITDFLIDLDLKDSEPNSIYCNVYVKIPGLIENIVITLKASNDF